jgi:hypothetical protein
MSCDARRLAVLFAGALFGAWTATAVPPVERGEPAAATAEAAMAPGPMTYKVVEGSYLVDDCRCGKPAVMIPVQGSFGLVRGRTDPLFEYFSVRGLLLGGNAAGASYPVTGAGSYRRGGEVAVVEEMTLAVTVGGRAGVTLESGLVAPQTAPPWLEIDLVETAVDRVQFYALHLVATPWPEVWFSTAQPFTPMASPGQPVSPGDLLSNRGRIVRRNIDLVGRLGVMPVVPDLGLDAAAAARPSAGTDAMRSEVWFSIPDPVFSETLGPLGSGDVLSERGSVVRRHDDLLKRFCAMPPLPDVGLDALEVGEDGTLQFSTDASFFSECLGRPISHGDLLAEDGTVVRRGLDLVAKFHVRASITGDVGLDAVYLWPHGEVWFSVTTPFLDERFGLIGDGDLLSDTGRVVARNLELVSAFASLEFSAGFGLDALHVPTHGPRVSTCGVLVQGVECVLFRADAGGLYVLQSTGRFKPGDRVRVDGEVISDCATFCTQGDGCLDNTTIEACPGRLRGRLRRR